MSSSGQMCLPASVRHRWNLDDGGPVDVLDLGFGVLAVPKGEGRQLLADLRARDALADGTSMPTSCAGWQTTQTSPPHEPGGS